MAKARNTWEKQAADAAARVDRAREQGAQLSLLPDEPGATPAEVGSDAPAKGGRPKGATSKHNSTLRRWLADRGYKMPEDQLAQIAGLASSDDVAVQAMAEAEAVLVWAYDGHSGKGGGKGATAGERLQVFLQFYTVKLRAAEALLPYGLAKAAPDVAVQQAVTLVLPGAAGPQGADQARDITPGPGQSAPSMVPADVRWQIQQNQQVSDASEGVSDSRKSDK